MTTAPLTTPTLDLTAFTLDHDHHHRDASTIPATCEHAASLMGRRCDLAHPHDITQWCFSCFRAHILDLRDGNGDSYAGAFDGHPESVEVIADALVDMSRYGPWGYSEEDDPVVQGRIDDYDPTDAELDELDYIAELARGWQPGGIDEDGSDGPDGDADGPDVERELAEMGLERAAWREIELGGPGWL